MYLPFSKYAGCGNDFILVDNRENIFPVHACGLIQSLCHRQCGIGADGVILVEKSSKADFKMRIFNADGSEAEMCGNGIRCLLKYLRELGYTGKTYTIETMLRCLEVAFEGENVKVQMGDPQNERYDESCDAGPAQSPCTLHHIDTGVPHVVMFAEDIEHIDLQKLGATIRHHPKFAPHGVNVNVASLCLTQNALRVRTFERGVEAETLACGTGATAVALIAAHKYGLKSPITVHTKSKETLDIAFSHKERTHRHPLSGKDSPLPSAFSNVTMCGPATYVYRGNINIRKDMIS